MTAKKTPAAATTAAPPPPPPPPEVSPGIDPDLVFDFSPPAPASPPVAPPQETPTVSEQPAPRYYTRRGPFDYAGRAYGRCELIALKPGARNNEKLIEGGYVAEVPGDAEVAVCGECGREFLSDRFRRIHGDTDHAGRDAEADDEDALTKTMRSVNQEFPVFGSQPPA